MERIVIRYVSGMDGRDRSDYFHENLTDETICAEVPSIEMFRKQLAGKMTYWLRREFKVLRPKRKELEQKVESLWSDLNKVRLRDGKAAANILQHRIGPLTRKRQRLESPEHIDVCGVILHPWSFVNRPFNEESPSFQEPEILTLDEWFTSENNERIIAYAERSEWAKL